MPCILGCLALAAPRTALFLVWLFSDYLGRAYDTVLWPLLGFFFLPLTTLTFAWATNSHGSVSGGYVVAVVLAILLDLGLVGGGTRRYRRRDVE